MQRCFWVVTIAIIDGCRLFPNVCVACSNQKLPIMFLNCGKAMKVEAHTTHISLLVIYFMFLSVSYKILLHIQGKVTLFLVTITFPPLIFFFPMLPLLLHWSWESKICVSSISDDVRARTRLTSFSSWVGNSVQVWWFCLFRPGYCILWGGHMLPPYQKSLGSVWKWTASICGLRDIKS